VGQFKQGIYQAIKLERKIMSQSGGNNVMVFITAMTVGVGIIAVSVYLSGVLGMLGLEM